MKPFPDNLRTESFIYVLQKDLSPHPFSLIRVAQEMLGSFKFKPFFYAQK